MNEEPQAFTLEALQPFPLEKSLQSLPQQFRDEFASLYELVKGYVRNLKLYQDLEKQLRDAVNDTISTINSIIRLLEEYESHAAIISEKAERLDRLYKDFLTLETLQYQLLSSNFDQTFLKAKFRNLVASSDMKSGEIIGSYKENGGDMTQFLLDFKNSRKLYHARREKLHRWDEERVSGFL
ncbi:hypothetical protein METBIDRAFT_35497 [Metschnikowia bicuspidata var. bicuspidata NRRL YB-4993]|uniref:VPS37 C-terminal domain-containing protein n=1 Tax=Metschnikowia bicuspidata var. bicuspidata NRRL YB-4993 TaxID=869754 RepID=A0A1A0HHW5_9ASCO|nr:hypothetical protein METBIDRAFT_35497 [Metschnikowia bicuspidata var. bicuspidata NRRL YB-4993]OBA23472.1 hypothetical protein METBIDRAFT_35497 [Metschnikowia bicuspidata var. bicuspidata NRRL YB-4993]